MPAKRKKAAKRKTSAKKKVTPARRAPSRAKKKQQKRWPAERLLSEARIRTRQIGLDAKPAVQQMLAHLLDEAGWTQAQFVKALVADVEARR